MCSSSSNSKRSNDKKQTFAAVIFDRSTAKKTMEKDESLREPLLTNAPNGDNSENSNGMSSVSELDPSTVKQIKVCCIIFGLLIGFFMQISSIGANFLTTIPWNQIWHADNNSTSTVATSFYLIDSRIRAAYSVLWTFITVFATGCIIMVVRYLFEITFNMRLDGFLFSRNRRESMLEEMVHYFECYFSLGVLIAVTLGWFGVAFLLGMPTTLCDILITIAFPIFWCWTFCLIFNSKPDTATTTSEPSSETVLLV